MIFRRYDAVAGLHVVRAEQLLTEALHGYARAAAALRGGGCRRGLDRYLRARDDHTAALTHVGLLTPGRRIKPLYQPIAARLPELQQQARDTLRALHEALGVCVRHSPERRP